MKKEEKQPPPEPSSKGGGRDKNKEEKAERESSSSDSSECSDDSGPEEILIPEPGMSVWQYVCMEIFKCSQRSFSAYIRWESWGGRQWTSNCSLCMHGNDPPFPLSLSLSLPVLTPSASFSSILFSSPPPLLPLFPSHPPPIPLTLSSPSLLFILCSQVKNLTRQQRTLSIWRTMLATCVTIFGWGCWSNVRSPTRK